MQADRRVREAASFADLPDEVWAEYCRALACQFRARHTGLDADDLWGEAWLGFCEARANYNPWLGLRPYSYATTRILGRLLDYKRAQLRVRGYVRNKRLGGMIRRYRPVSLEILANHPAPDPDPEAQALDALTAEHLTAALEVLTEAQACAVQLFFFEGLSGPEIGRRTGNHRTWAWNRRIAALIALRRAVSAEVVL